MGGPWSIFKVFGTPTTEGSLASELVFLLCWYVWFFSFWCRLGGSLSGIRDRPVTQNDTCQQRSLDPWKTGSALYCGGGMPFAVDSDDCRSSDVARL